MNERVRFDGRDDLELLELLDVLETLEFIPPLFSNPYSLIPNP